MTPSVTTRALPPKSGLRPLPIQTVNSTLEEESGRFLLPAEVVILSTNPKPKSHETSYAGKLETLGRKHGYVDLILNIIVWILTSSPHYEVTPEVIRVLTPTSRFCEENIARTCGDKKRTCHSSPEVCRPVASCERGIYRLQLLATQVYIRSGDACIYFGFNLGIKLNLF